MAKGFILSLLAHLGPVLCGSISSSLVALALTPVGGLVRGTPSRILLAEQEGSEDISALSILVSADGTQSGTPSACLAVRCWSSSLLLLWAPSM